MHFVAKETLFEDYPWTLGYYLTLQSNQAEEFIFPTFEEAVVDVNDQSDSQVSQVFARAYQLLHSVCEAYYVDPEEENLIKASLDEFFINDMKEKDNVQAHGAKKLGIQTLGNLLTINIQDISMRGGWALKAFNTFFDYWVGSLPSSVRSRKMIAGWIQVRSILILIVNLNLMTKLLFLFNHSKISLSTYSVLN